MNIDQEYEDDFYESERVNAINEAMKWLNIPEGYSILENPESHCAINHNPNRGITARVHLSYKNKKTEFIATKIINLRFIGEGAQTSWAYVDSQNG